MRRRVLLAATTAAALSPAMVRAQQKAMPVIGFLSVAVPDAIAPLLAAFRQGLSEAGYVEGQSVSVEYRWAEGRYDRLPALAADLVARKVDVIVTTAGTNGARVAKAATSTIPIVFNAVGDDPVAIGLVASLARPGGNLTGSSVLTVELNPKRLELLRELVPRAGVIALLVNPNNVTAERVIRDMQETAGAKGVQLQVLKAGSESEIDAAFASLAEGRAGALVVQGDSAFSNRREQIVALAARHAVPAIYGPREYAMARGLISYSPSTASLLRQAGIYAGKILKGAKPADLPVVQPTVFEMVVNLRTAKVLGLTIPPSVLARADEVIE